MKSEEMRHWELLKKRPPQTKMGRLSNKNSHLCKKLKPEIVFANYKSSVTGVATKFFSMPKAESSGWICIARQCPALTGTGNFFWVILENLGEAKLALLHLKNTVRCKKLLLNSDVHSTLFQTAWDVVLQKQKKNQHTAPNDVVSFPNCAWVSLVEVYTVLEITAGGNL